MQPKAPHIAHSVELLLGSTTHISAAPVRTTYRNRIRFQNGWQVSWVAAHTKAGAPGGVYCEPVEREHESHAVTGNTHRAAYARVEVAVFNPQDEMVPFASGDTVKGFCDPAQLLDILNWAAAQKA